MNYLDLASCLQDSWEVLNHKVKLQITLNIYPRASAVLESSGKVVNWSIIHAWDW